MLSARAVWYLPRALFDTSHSENLESFAAYSAPMEANVDHIARELAALTQRFVDLGARLAETARGLEDAGAPPATGLVDELVGARGQFVQLRSHALSTAAAVGVTHASDPQSLHDLEPLLAAIEEALREQVRREALAQAQHGAVSTLDRVRQIIHYDDPKFAALGTCHDQAHETRAAVMALTEIESDDARRTIDRIGPFADLLALVENRDGLDDDRYAELEESVSRGFGRPLAVAAARGRLGFEGDILETPPTAEPEAAAVAVPAPESAETLELEDAAPSEVEPDAASSAIEEELAAESALELEATEAALELESSEPVLEMEEPAAPEPVTTDSAPASDSSVLLEFEPDPVAVVAATDPAPAAEASADPSAPDETAQWWLAAWARWSGWKSSHDFSSAVREELGKYPYLLSVPIQKSPDYEDGLLAYGYSLLMDHVEKQNPGCVGNALNNLKPGQNRPVGEQLYDYLISEGKLRDTYGDFIRQTLLAAVPEPGLWFQFRILESKEDTRILQRPSARIGDTELSGQRLASDGQRYNEHKFKMTLGPLTTRFVLVSADVKDSRSAGFKLAVDGTITDTGWVAGVPAGARSTAKSEAKRIPEDGLHVTGLGKDYSGLWVAVFNPDPLADHRYELSVFLRKDSRSPFKTKG
jgi:hypothetical protein